MSNVKKRVYVTAPSSMAGVRRLVDWVAGSGGRVHAAVCMQAGRQGFGLAAGAPVRAGEVLVRLPVELQLMQDSDDEPLKGTSGIPGNYTMRPVFAPAAARVVSSVPPAADRLCRS